MVGQDDLLGDLIELGGIDGWKRVVLGVNCPGLQAQVNLGKWQRRWIGTKCLAQEQPGIRPWHAQFQASQIGRHLNVTGVAQVELAGAKVANVQQLDAHFIGNRLFEFRAQFALHYIAVMFGVLEKIAGGKQAKCRNRVRNGLKGHIGHFGVATLQCVKIAVLAEQRAGIIKLDVKKVWCKLVQFVGKDLHGPRMQIGGDRDRSKFQFDGALCLCRALSGNGQRCCG